MRNFVSAAVAVLALGLIDSRPASAAWECMGPPASCIKATKTELRKTKTAKTSYGVKKQAYTKKVGHKTRAAKAKPSGYQSVSYSGGSSYTGVASYYWQGQRTASGSRFNPSGLTAAHRTLPFGTKVRVTHLGNGRSVTVTINDRGPFIRGRIIDLSRGAAGVIGMTASGVARVSVDVLGRG